MRAVIQKVGYASCTINGQVTASIGKGYCIFVGFTYGDNEEIIRKMIHKVINLRIFDDENGKMNLSIQKVGGSILSVSQFTLYADCHKGNRPGFTAAAKPAVSIPLYDRWNALLGEHIPVETGSFGADMKIDLLNDGPITIVLDSKEIF